MKHNIKITVLLLAMFLVTQLLGLYVVNHYSPVKVVQGEIQNVSAPDLPFGLKSPEIQEESDYYDLFSAVIIAFILAISLLFLFTKLKLKIILKGWFFIVITIALGVFMNAVIPQFNYSNLVALAVALPLAFIKIFKKNLIVHNITELMIYPGISAVFVAILNIWTVIILLVLISIYDMWAVWKSKIMQKMAKFQINELNIFSGFLVPSIPKNLRLRMKKMKNSKLRKEKVRINVAILGGGDVVFPIIASGVILKTGTLNLPFGLHAFVGGFIPALFVITGALLGLGFLFLFSEKKKFYPAMPFISAGIFLGILLSYLVF